MDALVVAVPVDRALDVAATKLLEDLAFLRVALAEVLTEVLHGPVVTLEQCTERTAWSDGGELAVVTDEDHLCTGGVTCLEEVHEVAIVGHGGFVEDHDMSRVEVDAAVVDPPPQRRQRARVVGSGFAAEGARCLARGRRAEHGVAGGSV